MLCPGQSTTACVAIVPYALQKPTEDYRNYSKTARALARLISRERSRPSGTFMLCMCTRHVGSDAVLGSVDVSGWVDGEHLLFFILYFLAFRAKHFYHRSCVGFCFRCQFKTTNSLRSVTGSCVLREKIMQLKLLVSFIFA